MTKYSTCRNCGAPIKAVSTYKEDGTTGPWLWMIFDDPGPTDPDSYNFHRCQEEPEDSP